METQQYCEEEEVYEEDVEMSYDPYDAYCDNMDDYEDFQAASENKNIYYDSVDALFNHIKLKCSNQIMQIFSNLSHDQVLMLLLDYAFNFEKLLNQIGQNLDQVLEKCNIRPLQLLTKKECQICLSTIYESCEACCQDICQSCMDQYIKTSINEWKLNLQCPTCKCKILPSSLKKDVSFKFKKRYVIMFMRKETNYTECLDCCKYIQFWRNKKIVECECHCEICRKCGAFAHQPLSCQQYSKWNAKIVDESRNLLWVMKNSKKCGNCGWYIEKNSGCNHMTCQKCKYQFCWLCLGNWKQHRNCSAFNGQGKLVQTKIKQSSEDVKKLQLYGIRYQNFQQGQKFAKKMKQDLPQKIRIMCFILDSFPSNFTFFEEAINIIIMTRRRVKCLYAYIFMAKLTNQQKQILEWNLQQIQLNLQELTLTIQGVFEQLNFQSCNEQQVMSLQKKIIQYKELMHKFMNKIIESTEIAFKK